MKKRVPISKIMTTDLATLNPTQSLSEAEKLFSDLHIRHIPIVEDSRLVGIISRSDLLKISYTDFDEETEKIESIVFDRFTIPQVMTKNPVTVTANTTIRETARILSLQSFNALPVIDKGKLVGIITTQDLVAYLLEQY